MVPPKPINETPAKVTNEPKTIALAQHLTPQAIENILIGKAWQGQLNGQTVVFKFFRQGSGLSGNVKFDDGDKLNLRVITKKVEYNIVSIVMTGQRVNDGVTIKSTLYANISKDSTTLIGNHEMIYKQGSNEYTTSERWAASSEKK